MFYNTGILVQFTYRHLTFITAVSSKPGGNLFFILTVPVKFTREIVWLSVQRVNCLRMKLNKLLTWIIVPKEPTDVVFDVVYGEGIGGR